MERLLANSVEKQKTLMKTHKEVKKMLKILAHPKVLFKHQQVLM